MTKLEYLKNLAKSDSGEKQVETIYTWKSQGSLVANDDTKIYNSDTLYYISASNCDINGYLVYCQKECKGHIFTWANAKFYDYQYGEISFGNDIVSPYFNVILTKTEFDTIKENYYKLSEYRNFIPFKDLETTSKVIINEEDYIRCLKPVGVPFITEEELEYTRDEITELAIKPALEEYFHWIPNTRSQEVQVPNNEINVAMPTDAYCVVGISLQQFGSAVSGNVLSPLYYGLEQSLYGNYAFSTLTGTFTGNNPYTATSSMSTMINNRSVSQAIINYSRRVHYEGPYVIHSKEEAEKLGLKDALVGSKYIRLYSNQNGIFNIWWGIQTLNFNDIEYAERTRVIEYAQACVKDLFGSIRSLARTDVPGQLDYSKWPAEAEKTKSDIRGAWMKMVKYAGIERGSL